MIGTKAKVPKDCKTAYEKVKKEKRPYAIFSLDEVTIFTFKHYKIY